MADAAIHGHDHEDERSFFQRWFMSTNHKDIGILYLVFSALAGLISVLMTVYMRLELMHPGVQYMCLEGFMADQRDAYPGINAVTLLDIKGDEAALAQKDRLLPVVKFAVEMATILMQLSCFATCGTLHGLRKCWAVNPILLF